MADEAVKMEIARQSIGRTENGVEFRLPDKLAAIRADNDLAGEGAESAANDALTQLLVRIRERSGPPQQR